MGDPPDWLSGRHNPFRKNREKIELFLDRLMMVESLDAAAAAFEVGYENPSQFNENIKSIWPATTTRHHIHTTNGYKWWYLIHCFKC